ncbi:MAG TPA: methyltransferase domain-containing protein [Candidatus Eisenbacteria bacterium]|nr:methyltransferase domain-containing protein [Candidatus Eisenbacteria bacterium]
MKRKRHLLAGLLSAAMLSACSALPRWTAGDVPFVPTPPEVIERMLEMARVGSNDVVYDLGSGDGRIVIRAAQKYGVRGVGVEIDPDLVTKARGEAARQGVGHLVEFHTADALAVDLSPATVVTLYMLPEFNTKLRPVLERDLKPGSRVVAHDFAVDGWIADRVEVVKGGLFHDHRLFLFEIR